MQYTLFMIIFRLSIWWMMGFDTLMLILFIEFHNVCNFNGIGGDNRRLKVYSWNLCILYNMQGGEMSLQKALNIIHKNSRDYVAVLFYASWCPFSRTFRPNFSIMASLYPSIPHFAIEESTIRPRFVLFHFFHLLSCAHFVDRKSVV